MTEALNPAATGHLPIFVTSPGEGDALLVAMGVLMLLAVISIGVLYFKLHSLPEHLAHRGQKLQLEIVAVLGLLALFTHNHLFWVAGLLLALVPLPDFSTPLTSIAHSLRKIAGEEQPAGETGLLPEPEAVSEAKAITPHGSSRRPQDGNEPHEPNGG